MSNYKTEKWAKFIAFFDDEEVKFAFEVFEIVDIVRINLNETVYAEQASKLEPLAYIVEKTSRRKLNKLDSISLIVVINLLSSFRFEWLVFNVADLARL